MLVDFTGVVATLRTTASHHHGTPSRSVTMARRPRPNSGRSNTAAVMTYTASNSTGPPDWRALTTPDSTDDDRHKT